MHLLLKSLMYIENTYECIWPHISYTLKWMSKIATTSVPHLLFYCKNEKVYVKLMIPSNVMRNLSVT